MDKTNDTRGLGALFGEPVVKKVSDLEIFLKNIKNWTYYDNYLHGKRVDQNDPDYGPITVYNATVMSGQEKLFEGDVSKMRMEALENASAKLHIMFNIIEEGKQWGIYIINGTRFIYKMNGPLMVCERVMN